MMYPLLRMAKETLLAHRSPRLAPFEAHVSQHICWPWDIDPWMELNNGRTLTLFDLGRIPFALRSGLVAAAKARGWGITAAGNSVRYRRRVRMFHRVRMVTRILGWDGRFFYIEQSMWRRGKCLNHMLLRSAVTSAQGIVPPDEVVREMGHTGGRPALPDWVQAWIAADAQRPWPPEVAPPS
jgi:acyl-CoA thioesterase FadM